MANEKRNFLVETTTKSMLKMFYQHSWLI